ncbi:MAG: DUF4835 family protein [Ignavibacteria bacterium]|nr:DUF4835 family protein [Ignavibacteria bacterium]
MLNSIKYITILLLFSLSVIITCAQDFEATVILNMEALPPDARDRLKDFKQQTEDYLNKNKFADGPIYKIKVTLQFNFRGTNGFDGYEAQLFVISQRIVDDSIKQWQPKYVVAFRYLDEKCSFNYNRTMLFVKNDVRFDSYLSLLDYYAYMVLGYDEDSFFPKGGNKYFQKALDICNKPMTDRKGWTAEVGTGKPSRAELVQELLNSRMDDFRLNYYKYHWEGVDNFYIHPYNQKTALNTMLEALEKIGDLKKREVKAYNIDYFFEAKAQEIGQFFLAYGDRTVYDRLARIDPAHQRIYEEFKTKGK